MMTADHTVALFDEVSRSGYYPEIVAEGLRDALAAEAVAGYVLHHEPTFDRDEILDLLAYLESLAPADG